ncbi:porin [Flaviaesturariibacter flavus]|uniref:Porin n=1 Tax=Flaviaesturariibacter flavus TaxID=2502780 RepID=A0A4V2NWV1_9BACT|nr:porin [Flaviaesturariibacter flavus]TCJ18782.1 porin [Flaviaesturariibacter flavus]
MSACVYRDRVSAKAALLLLSVLLLGASARAQRFLSEYDSTLFLRDTMVRVVSRFENLHFSGYMQPQFQLASTEGAPSFEGGNFAPHSSSRFMLRRARVKLDYQVPDKHGPLPFAVFTFQIDATERGSIVRDMFARVYLPGNQAFSATAGLFARPFGYEVNLSSGFRESPERARASQVLMPGERDLGAMISIDPVKRRAGAPGLKLDAGLFNGPGVTATTDFDSYKDIIGRLTLKPYTITKGWLVGGGLSVLYGGWRQDTKYRYDARGGNEGFSVDSSESNTGARAPRHYYGADVQLEIHHGWGKTELRAEYWRGTQPGTATTTANPGAQPEGPTYIRPFDAGIFYFLQNIGSPRWELGLKYDWFDPNRLATGSAIGKPDRNYTVADIRYDTWSGGLTFYVNRNLKVLAWYNHVLNEHTALPAFTSDARDDVFTLRTQLRF